MRDSGQIGAQIGGQIGGQLGGQISATQQKIIDLIIENNKISRNKLALKISINESAIQKHLKKLIDLAIIERIGGTRGYWKIIGGQPV